MRRALVALVALAGLAVTVPASAKMLDCPLRDAPFSMRTPLIDIMLSPAASAVVDAKVPGLLKKMPPQMFSTKAPTFASILTVKEAAGMGARFGSGQMPDLAGLDEALAKVPVTDADRIARCARYDDDRPSFALPVGKPRILLFEKMTGFKDEPGFNAAHAAFLDIARQKGWGIVATDKGGAINPATLAKFDAVIWNNVSGDVLTLTQRKALKDYVEKGGGFVAVHGAGGDPVYFWDWYVDSLIGARFIGHPIGKQFQPARIVVEDRDGPIGRGLPPEWTMTDEWYSFAASPRLTGAKVIAKLDETTYQPQGMGTQDLHMGDHPIAWSRCVGKGRSFYSAIGHRPEGYSEPHYRLMLANAIGWAATGPGCVTK
ncbi:MAG TPA: ThuA domain-containing protein [Sphingobium sp.]|uniref:ThuA domain-containing protein n=1 Tax=Sphingobium sp. TaxID=1912891 RepID=UPI002ED2041E